VCSLGTNIGCCALQRARTLCTLLISPRAYHETPLGFNEDNGLAALCGSLHLGEGMLLFVTCVTCWEIFLLRPQIDRGAGQGSNAVDML